jgi:RES domain-containing protein
MAIYWRISNHLELTGTGGLIASGRWHTRGVPVVYLAESPTSALLENLVHLEISERKIPEIYTLLEIAVPDDLAVHEIHPTIADWQQNQHLTRELGDAWLAARETPLAKVPSAVAPKTWNMLLNPLHPNAADIKIVSATQEAFDLRLFRIGQR